MSVMEILGQDRIDDSILWVKFDDTSEVAVTDIALAVARRTFQRDEYEQPTLRGHLVDEEMVNLLIRAMDSPQPPWSPGDVR